MKNDFATKADLKKTADGLHKEIAAVKTALSGEITSVRTELREEMASVKTELHKEISSVKDSLQKDIELVAVQVVQVSNDLHEFKQETRERFDGVMTAIDGLAGLITNEQIEKASVDHALQRHDNKLDIHETRIGALEEKIK